MKLILSISGALLLLATFYFLGLVDQFNIAHPIWRTNAMLIGSSVGIIIAVVLIWIGNRKPAIAGYFATLIGAILLFSIAASAYYANIFINAENYDPFAIQVWHIGSYVFFITFVPTIACILYKISRKF